MDYRQIAARVHSALIEKGWSVRELGRRAGFGDSARAGNALRNLEKGGSTSPDTLHAFAVALGVADEWLLFGRTEPAEAHDQTTPAATAAAEEADEQERNKDLPPGSLGQNKNHQRSKKVAKKIAPDVEDEWVWEDLDTVDTLFLGTREPSPQVLADLARLIQKHGKPR